MSSQGRPYARFRRALGTGNLTLIRAAAAELPRVDLSDALAILPVIAGQQPDLYERAACRWLARLALEREVGLDEIRRVLAALERLPSQPGAYGVLAEAAGD